ncbi:MAG TPA: mannosyltransferase family protein [Solirubrobacteraceae bacterium]|nr:mannosyltransferase family protein [Solirubrobacteraceae bacterium]
MNSDTAELAIADPPGELVGALGGSTARGEAARHAHRRREARRRQSLRERVRAVWAADPARALAVRDCWRALWSSRLLIWLAGAVTLSTYGSGPVRHAFNPAGLTRGLGWLGNALAAPAARWDAAWYLVIARYGYRPDLGPYTSSRDAFFPLYPLAVRAIGASGVPLVLAGVLVSIAALALALYGIHRLTTLELGGATARARQSLSARARPVASSPASVARLAVLVTAFAPMAFFLSAAYSESLYLALSVGLFYAARRGRFLTAGALAALAAATRSAGVVLLLPALMLYVYGPREDRRPDFARARGLAPRYRLRKDALWLALAPLGLLAYMLYLSLAGGDALAPFHAQDVWGRHFAGPYVGAFDGLRAAFDGARQLISAQQRHLYFPAGGGSAFVASEHNLLLLAFLLAGAAALVGVLRALPLAYGAYVIAALALPLSYPVTSQPLMSLPRFLVVLFPLGIWFAAWLAEHPRAQRPALVCSGLLLAFFTAEFATWHWVA